ncbi:MAG TPA: glycosyltransferase [Solirubrobacteraceae bacterium]|nr:glycosyltransferase [Solirubrobacteraceae bacterium]
MTDAARSAVDVLLVSLGSTAGLRAADAQLVRSLRRAGASIAVASASPPRAARTLALTDLTWALAARAATRSQLQRSEPRAILYSTTTAALLWPRPGAIRFDAAAAANRPGRHGVWQRPLERRRLRQAPLLVPWSGGALDELPAALHTRAHALVVPVAVEPSAQPGAVSTSGPQQREPGRDIAVIAYAANPSKKGIDRVLAAWQAVRREGEELVLAGAEPADLRALGAPCEGGGVRSVGRLDPAEYRALLRRARVFACAPRREDYGIAQLEALADGCQLVTTPAPGPYAALAIARALDARLVGEDLAPALRTALDDPSPDYGVRALGAIAPFGREAVDEVVARELLPRLLG